MLDAMGDVAETTAAAITELWQSLDLLHGRVASVDTTQQNLVAQMGLISDAVKAGSQMNLAATRQLTVIEDKLTETFARLDRLQRRVTF
jgi:hypothetical protein